MIRISLRTLAVIAVLLLMSGCKTTKVISEWDAGRDNIEKRERIAVVAKMPESLQRLVVELLRHHAENEMWIDSMGVTIYQGSALLLVMAGVLIGGWRMRAGARK